MAAVVGIISGHGLSNPIKQLTIIIKFHLHTLSMLPLTILRTNSIVITIASYVARHAHSFTYAVCHSSAWLFLNPMH